MWGARYYYLLGAVAITLLQAQQQPAAYRFFEL
jgi:hypothetical protein